MWKLILCAILAIGLSLSVNSTVLAYPYMAVWLSSGSTGAIVQDNGPFDSNPLAGAITYSGTFGNWVVNVTTALSYPILGSPSSPQLHLNSVNAGIGNLIVEAAVWDLNTSSGEATLQVGGTTDGTVKFHVHDDVFSFNVASSLFGPGAFSGQYTATGSPGNTLLDVWADITHTTYGVTSFDADVTSPVPIPAAVWLLGTGLVGLLGIRRKFQK